MGVLLEQSHFTQTMCSVYFSYSSFALSLSPLWVISELIMLLRLRFQNVHSSFMTVNALFSFSGPAVHRDRL